MGVLAVWVGRPLESKQCSWSVWFLFPWILIAHPSYTRPWLRKGLCLASSGNISFPLWYPNIWSHSSLTDSLYSNVAVLLKPQLPPALFSLTSFNTGVRANCLAAQPLRTQFNLLSFLVNPSVQGQDTIDPLELAAGGQRTRRLSETRSEHS